MTQNGKRVKAPSAEDVFIHMEEGKRLQAWLNENLAPLSALVFWAHFGEGKTCKEIADLTGNDPERVKQIIAKSSRTVAVNKENLGYHLGLDE